MIDGGDAPSLIGGAMGLTTITGLIVARFIKRADKNEAAVESTQSATLNSVATAVTEVKTSVSEIKSDMRVLTAELHHARGEGSKTTERIEGISENYGGRLSNLENRVTVIETKAAKVKR